MRKWALPKNKVRKKREVSVEHQRLLILFPLGILLVLFSLTLQKIDKCGLYSTGAEYGNMLKSNTSAIGFPRSCSLNQLFLYLTYNFNQNFSTLKRVKYIYESKTCSQYWALDFPVNVSKRLQQKLIFRSI